MAKSSRQPNHFFSNRSVNLINLHYGLHNFSLGFGGIFLVVYLYKAGLQPWQIFLAFAAGFFLRLVLRPVSLWFALKNGLKRSVILGSLIFIGTYLALYFVDGFNKRLLFYLCYFAIADIFYWMPFHAYYASLGTREHRGKHLGVREALVSMGLAVSPFISGFLIEHYGFLPSFIAASFFVLLSIIPLLRIPDISAGEKLTIKQAYLKTSKAGVWIFIGDSIYTSGVSLIWPLVLFLLFNDYVTYGWLISLAMLFQALGFLFLGNIVDNGHGRMVYTTAQILGLAILFGRAGLAFSVPVIIFFDLLYAVFNCFYMSSLMSMFYNKSHQSQNTLWFQYFSESGWDIGTIIIACIAALVTFNGHSMRSALLFSSFGLVIFGIMCREHYCRAN